MATISEEAIKELADIVYLSQNTGVPTSVMNEAYEKVGILGSTYSGTSVSNEADLARKLLEENGYTPGSNKNFYGSNQAQDEGAKLLSDQWQLAPDENVVNDNKMNSLWLYNKLGGDTSKTLAGSILNQRNLGDVTEKDYRQQTQDTYNQFVPGRSTKDELDIFEWGGQQQTGTTTTGTTTGTGTGSTATVTTGGGGTAGSTGGTDTGSTGGTSSIYTSTGTPNIGTVTPNYGTTVPGVSQVDIPTYEAGLSSQQQQFQQRAVDQQQFFTPQTLQEQQAAGVAPAFENVLYRNRFGMSMYVQHINGVPSQPIPPGYFPVQGFVTQNQMQGQNQGGVIQGFNTGATVNPAMNFKPGGTVVEENGIFKIKYPDGTFSQGYDTSMNAKAALDMGTANLGLPDYNTYLTQQGYDQNLPGFDQDTMYGAYQSYISDPTTLQNIKDQQAAADAEANKETQTGNINQDQATGQQTVTGEDITQAQKDLLAQAAVAPGGAVAASPTDYIDPNAYGTVIDSTAGQASGVAPIVTDDQVAQIGTAAVADTPENTGAETYTADKAFDDVKTATEGMDPAQSEGPTKTIDAQTSDTSLISGLEAATGESVDVTGAPTRELTELGGTSELITGTGVDQSKVMEIFGEGELKAASVQDEMASLMAQFEGGNTPAWAKGAIRSAMATMSARGLGASSMAGEAIIQAALESALPMAQIDASNKQEVAIEKARQRATFLGQEFDQAFEAKVRNAATISAIANINFDAQQQIALENSKAANTMELQNLSNKQALILAEASSLSGMDLTNLNNRQQAEVQNAQNFLQIDMSNLTNEQQTALFKNQSLISSILSDQAAENAALQFNATSENQTTQFFANLAASIGQFNAAQINAMSQFNADEVNSLLEFNATIQNQRELFNAQNFLAVAQANALWRQNLTTINTAAANESNMEYAQTVNGLTLKMLDEIWQRERDIMDYSFTQSENAADRALSILLGDKKLEAIREQLDAEEQQALGSLMTKIFFSSDAKSLMAG